MNSRRKLEQSFKLFRGGYSIAEVARKLRITFKEAWKLKRIYIQNEEIYEKIQRSNPEITDYYKKEVEKQEYKEIADRLIKNVKKRRKEELDNSHLENGCELILKNLANVQEILFFSSAGEFLSRWVLKKEFFNHSPLFSSLRSARCLN